MASTATVTAHQLRGSSASVALATWDDDRLRSLLEGRPDLAAPPPQTLAELAERAVAAHSAEAAYHRLDRSAQQVVEVLTLLSPPAALGDVAAMLAAGVGPGDLERPLARLESLALVFRDGDTVTLNPGFSRLPHRAGIGPPIAAVLGAQPAFELAGMCRRLGLKPGRNKNATVAAIAGHIGHPDQARRLVGKGPPGTLELAERAAWGLVVSARGGVYALDDRTPAGWLARRGFLAAADWYRLVMPGEVGLALRGGHAFEEFSPDEPAMASVPVDAARVDAAGAEQALRVVSDLASVLEGWGSEPAKLLKDGGVGVRDLRRAAKAIGRSERDTARLLDVAVAAGLVWVDEGIDAALPTATCDEWFRLDATARWTCVVSGWLAADFTPSLAGAIDNKQKPIPPLLRRVPEPGAVERRLGLLEAMSAVASGSTAAARAISTRARWSRPDLWQRPPAIPAVLADWVIEECELLGLTAQGSLTTAGRRAAAGDLRGATAALAERAPALVTEFVLQADLTAVAAGALAPEVATELELLADVESRGAAGVYRFSEQSLRRAFDAGRTAAEITTFLERHAARGVPQALAYLVADTGRRHGKARVGAARCYVRSDDPALLAELAQARAAARLGLRALAPTVLVADSEPATVLTTLRGAGYLPAAEDSTGALVVIRPATRRAPARAPRTEGRHYGEVSQAAEALRRGDLDTLKAVLQAAPRPDSPSGAGQPAIDVGAVVAGLRRTSGHELPHARPPARKPPARKPPARKPPASKQLTRKERPPVAEPPVPAPRLFADGPERPSAVVKDPEAIRELLEQACDDELALRVSYTNGKGVTSQLNVIAVDLAGGKLLVENLPGFNSRTLKLDRVHWARALTEAEEDQLL